jgi:glycosyltransferase involved in cell wall biosynthesis
MGPELCTYLRPAFARIAGAIGNRIDADAPWLADRVLVLDDATLAALSRRGFPAHRIRVAPLPASPPPGCPSFPGRTARRGAPVRAVYVGNLDAYQGVDVLLAALRAAPALREALALDIVTASDPRRLEAEISRLGLSGSVRVSPHGSVHDAWRALADADIAVVPRSAPGGFPIKLVNALSAGVATIADSAIAVPLEHGVDAWLVDMRSPEALAAGLVALAASPKLRDRLARGAALAAWSRHDPARYVAAVEETYVALEQRRR